MSPMLALYPLKQCTHATHTSMYSTPFLKLDKMLDKIKMIISTEKIDDTKILKKIDVKLLDVITLKKLITFKNHMRYWQWR